MDEVDSIGSARTENSGGGGDSEVQRTMLELLNQLDGFEATNKIKVGRLPPHVHVLATGLIQLLVEFGLEMHLWLYGLCKIWASTAGPRLCLLTARQQGLHDLASYHYIYGLKCLLQHTHTHPFGLTQNRSLEEGARFWDALAQTLLSLTVEQPRLAGCLSLVLRLSDLGQSRIVPIGVVWKLPTW